MGAEQLSLTTRRTARSGLHGALLAAWWGLWFFLLVRSSDRGWWLTDLSPSQLDEVFGFETILSKLAETYFGVAFVPSMEGLFMALIIVGALAGAWASMLMRHLRIDPERRSWQAMKDVLGDGRSLRILVALPLALCLLAGIGFGVVVAWMVAVVIALASPVLLLDRSSLSAPRLFDGGVLRWSWPGAWGALAAAGVLLADGLFDEVVDVSGKFLGWGWWLAGQIVSEATGIVAAILASAAWIDRMSWSRLKQSWRVLFRRDALATFLALDLRMLVIALWVAPPMMAWMVSSIWIVPSLQTVLEQEGKRLPEWWLQSRALASHGPVLAYLLAPALVAISGRLYVRAFPTPTECVESKPAAVSIAERAMPAQGVDYH